MIAQRGAGQPYLLAVKLKDEESRLHLRVVLENPAKTFAWANLTRAPQQIQDLVSNSTARSALAWSAFNGDGVWPSAEVANAIKALESSATPDKVITNLDAGTRLELAAYLGNPAYGIFFDPDKNHDAWLESVPVPEQVRSLIPVLSAQVAKASSIPENGDAIAEALEISAEQIAIFSGQLKNGNYEVDDLYANVKTRGSAQRVFSDAVKENYDYTCAVTGIKSREFLIASHIVPWSRDKTIRLDPSNGICLSLIVDKAFESGYLLINEDLTIGLNIEKMKNDRELQRHLKPYDGKTVAQPRQFPANPTYLKRRRDLLSKD